MNKKSIYFERLAELADYLSCMDDKIHVEEPEIVFFQHLNAEEDPYEVKYFAWAFFCLPLLFEDDWIYDEMDQPILFDSDECESTVNGIFSFFGIKSPSVFRHLFSPYSQLTKYYGNLLSDKPMPSDIAKNIMQFIESQTILA